MTKADGERATRDEGPARTDGSRRVVLASGAATRTTASVSPIGPYGRAYASKGLPLMSFWMSSGDTPSVAIQSANSRMEA